MSELKNSFGIRPFAFVARYATGWAGQRTFDEIYADLTPNLNRLLRYYGNDDLDVPDLAAHAFMRLWVDLSADSTFLAGVDKSDALRLLLNRANPQIFRKVQRHEVYLEDLATQSGEPDEFIIDGFTHGHSSGYADFAEAVDLRLDIERAIGDTAEQHIDSLPHLAALYYITTDVKPDDAAAIAGKGGTKKCWWLTNIVKPMRTELCEKLELFAPRKPTWQDRYRDGIEAPLLRLIDRYEADGNLRMVATIQSMAAYESCKKLMHRLQLPKSHIQYLRLVGHRELNKVYRCAA